MCCIQQRHGSPFTSPSHISYKSKALASINCSSRVRSPTPSSPLLPPGRPPHAQVPRIRGHSAVPLGAAPARPGGRAGSGEGAREEQEPEEEEGGER